MEETLKFNPWHEKEPTREEVLEVLGLTLKFLRDCLPIIHTAFSGPLGAEDQRFFWSSFERFNDSLWSATSLESLIEEFPELIDATSLKKRAPQ